jgi:hypothetical protein
MLQSLFQAKKFNIVKYAEEYLQRRIWIMTSQKKINIIVRKPYDYQPMTKQEQQRITNILSKEVLAIANRFDGPSRIRIEITATGNI